MRSGFLEYDEDFRLPVRARYQRVRRGVDAEQVRALRHRHGSGTLSGPLMRTCIATADHLGEIVRLLAIQLREHRIDLDSGRLEAAVRGVLEDPARDCAALDLEIDADHERVRSLYRRHGFEELPRRRLVRRLAGPDGA